MTEDLTAPNLNLTADEKRLYGNLFRQADSENIGVVTGEVAVKLFEKTRLEPRVLGEIWQVADKENRGLLTPAGFSVVLRLIGHYQAGREPTPELALRPGPLPKFDNVPALNLSPPLISSSVPATIALQPQSSGSGSIRVPPLTPEKARQYAALFEKSGAHNGVLPGDQAKQIFERAGLPNEILGRIWNLADTEQKGALKVTEFVIAMHLIASFKTGQLRALPVALPYGLYEAASRQSLNKPASGAISISSIPRQPSGTAQTSSSIGRAAYTILLPQLSSQATGPAGDWAIGPIDKLKFDNIYNSLDKKNQGFITGNEAVPFFSESKLSEDVLAQIWDLADINSTGRLTKDEFSVAMYLIRQQRGKRDERDSLPDILPANLIPPSMRNQERPAAVRTAPDFDAPTSSLSRSATEDLFGLDALSPHTTASEQVPQITGGSSSLDFARDIDCLGSTPILPSLTQTGQSQLFKPFAPSSSFGKSMNRQVTGGHDSSSSSIQGSLFVQASNSEDLLGDNDPFISSRLTSETTELANLSNQVGSLSKQMQDMEGQKTVLQNELTQATTQKCELEKRLSHLRSLYEQELREVQNLEEQFGLSQRETRTLKIEIESLQATLQGLRTQHQQTAMALQADQEDNARIKERMRAVNSEIAHIKPVLEKMKSDTRQQKGLVAINKNQLATSEAERDRLKNETEDLETRENAEIVTSSSRLHSPTRSASPAPSTTGAMNPFFRPKASLSETSHSYFTSPVGTQQSDRSLMNVFGPTFESATVTSEKPASNFENEGITSPIGLNSSVLSQSQKLDDSDSQASYLWLSKPNASQENQNVSELPPQVADSKQSTSSLLPSPLDEDSINTSRQVSASNNRFGEGFSSPDNTVNNKTNILTKSSAAGQIGMRLAADDVDQKLNSSKSVSDTTPEVFLKSEGTGSAKDDFDSAFAGFGSIVKMRELTNTTHSSGSGSFLESNPSGILKEFPPIAELENDDSQSDSDGVGFDDDFAPVSPCHLQRSSILVNNQPESGAINFSTPKSAEDTKYPTSSLDRDTTIPVAQLLPPNDNSFVVVNQGISNSNLYSSSPLSVPITAAALGPSSVSAAQDPPFVSPPSEYRPPQSSKIQSEDSFDDFNDLEDAREGDPDDDFAKLSSNYQSGIDKCNSMLNITTSKEVDPFQQNTLGRTNQQPTSNLLPPTVTSAVNDNHDWDAIFSGLDSSTTAVDSSQYVKVTEAIPSNLNTKERPEVGKWLDEADLPDDPILKKLTGMGYQRTDALSALEKYDYDLERVGRSPSN